MAQQSSKNVFAIDVGRSKVAIVANVNGLISSETFPPFVTPAVALTDETSAKKAIADTVEFSGTSFFVGLTAKSQMPPASHTGLSDDWFVSDEYKIIIKGAFEKILKATPRKEISANTLVVVGLPAQILKGCKDAVIAATQDALPEGVEVRLFSQPQGAFASYAYTTQGTLNATNVIGRGGRVRKFLILDVGLHTSDYMGTLEDFTVPERLIGYEVGLYSALEHVVKLVRNTNGFSVTPMHVEGALTSNTLIHMGKEIDISAHIHEGLEVLAKRLIAKGTSLWGKEIETADEILLAGGPAEALQPILSRTWPHTKVIPKPRMAIADGYCKLGILSLISRQEKAA